MGTARSGHRDTVAPLLRVSPAHQERLVGPLRAQRRRPGAADRAQPVPRVAPRARRGRQLAATPERPRSPPAADVVDRGGVQALRPPRVGGALSAGPLGPDRRARDVRVRRASLRPARRGVRGHRALDDARLLRASAFDARRSVRDGGCGARVRRAGGRGVRSGRAGADVRARARALAGDGRVRAIGRLREPRRPAGSRRASAGRRPRVGCGPVVVDGPPVVGAGR